MTRGKAYREGRAKIDREHGYSPLEAGLAGLADGFTLSFVFVVGGDVAEADFGSVLAFWGHPLEGRRRLRGQCRGPARPRCQTRDRHALKELPATDAEFHDLLLGVRP